jgi:putative methyltransferase (TIGR04325 family)
MQLKDFLPPIIIRAARRFVHAGSPLSQVRGMPIYKSYNAAASECVGSGYETSELVDVVCRKTAIYRDQLASNGPARLAGGDTLALIGIGLAHRCSQPIINVIDFGGACGAHYFLLKSVLMDSVKLKWHVVETPAMVNRAAELETDELRFFGSITDAASGFDRVDMAFSSGTLQCVSNAKEALHELLKPRPQLVVLARLGLTTGTRELVTIHETRLSNNGPGPLPPGCKDGTTRYPFTFPVQSEIESMLSEQYRIILSAPDPSGVFPVNAEPLVGVGYIARISDHAG